MKDILAQHWDASGPIAISQRSRPFLEEVHAPTELLTEDEELAWLKANSNELMVRLTACGALHFRGFNLPRTQAGLRNFCASLPVQPCEDPLASIGVRSLLSAADGVYEAVDAEALQDTYIGLHNDATYKLAAPYAAFACFRRATQGGAFLVADGRAILADLSPQVHMTPTA